MLPLPPDWPAASAAVKTWGCEAPGWLVQMREMTCVEWKRAHCDALTGWGPRHKAQVPLTRGALPPRLWRCSLLGAASRKRLQRCCFSSLLLLLLPPLQLQGLGLASTKKAGKAGVTAQAGREACLKSLA